MYQRFKTALAVALFMAVAINYKKVLKMGNLARGIRNNNPMNLRKTNIKWQGKTDGTDDSFETFVSPKYGIRAGAKVLLTYQNKYGLNTVEELINRFAPPSENDTQSYINSVASKIGVDPNEQINVSEHLYSLINAIIYHENGVNPYSDDTIKSGLALV